MSAPTDIEWAQLATWIDGEGTITIARTEPRGFGRSTMYIPLVCVSNNDTRVFDWLVPRFGGYRNTEREQTKTRKTSYQWIASKGRRGSLLIPLLQGVLPHLLLKRQQAEIVIRFYTEALWRNGGAAGTRRCPPAELERRAALRNAVTALNRKGPPTC